MRTAVIGVGVIGSLHAEILTEKNMLAAVCDTDENKLKKYNCPGYTDYKIMIDEVRPDCVHICTPHYLHAEMIIYALERGVNVLCEKPLCINSDQIKAVLEAEKHSTAKLGVCLQNRYNKENVFVKEYLAGKKVVCASAVVAWRRTKEYYNSAKWRGRYATEGGGVLINQALHTLDLLQYFAGMPKTLTASVSNLTLKGSIEVEDTAVLQSVKGAGISLFASVGCAADMPVVITVKTDKDVIQIYPGAVLINGVMQNIEKSTEKLRGKECYGSSHGLLIDDFYKHIKENKRFEIDGEEASKAVKLILAAYKSGGNETEV